MAAQARARSCCCGSIIVEAPLRASGEPVQLEPAELFARGPCPGCDGRGTISETRCLTCRGRRIAGVSLDARALFALDSAGRVRAIAPAQRRTGDALHWAHVCAESVIAARRRVSGQELEARMRAALLALSLTSNGRTTSYNPSGSGGTPDYALVDDRGRGRLAVGDAPQLEYAARWNRADDDDERQAIVEDAELELERITKAPPAPPTSWETAEQLAQRIVREGAGFSRRDVAIAMRTSARTVAAARAAAGVDPDLGQPIARPEDQHLSGDRRQRRVRELDARAVSAAGIARALGVSRSTVLRDLGRKA